MSDAVLAINAGSSSLKFALFEIAAAQLVPVADGQFEAIVTAPHFIARGPKGKVLHEQRWSHRLSDQELLTELLGFVDRHLGGDALRAVGHRIVHGGPAFDRSVRITDDTLQAIEALAPLAPLHQPHNIAPIRAIAENRPALLQVACFDTAFHHTMPPVAARLALPRRFEASGLRRYGFHGLSYEFIARRLRAAAPALVAGRVIVAHLGNGASLCAMLDGRSIDTTMGFSALDGLVMGTRCGTLDPGVVLYLIEQCGMAAKDVEALLYNESGLLGVSGLSNDMRTLLDSDAPAARDAVELFVYRLGREAGALASSLGGLDAFVFTAGIGEHAAAVRAASCERLAWLGLRLDAAANARGDAVISAPGSPVEIRVMPTDEQAMIARHTLDLID
ncbi:MAG TPA: acetate/propionate family kinase [Acetobacteraceae bacterium]|nr:acetate/propionate family kinase [Acetobacteraceae bacterium]